MLINDVIIECQTYNLKVQSLLQKKKKIKKINVISLDVSNSLRDTEMLS